MTWSQAARDAALIARRQHASGKKLKPMAWYHGGPPMRGTKLHNTVGQPVTLENGKRRIAAMHSNDEKWTHGIRHTSSASNKFKEAKLYSDAIKTWGVGTRSAMYSVTLAKPAAAKRIQRSLLLPNKGYREASAMGSTVKRLPQAKGRASRGKY